MVKYHAPEIKELSGGRDAVSHLSGSRFFAHREAAKQERAAACDCLPQIEPMADKPVCYLHRLALYRGGEWCTNGSQTWLGMSDFASTRVFRGTRTMRSSGPQPAL